MPAYKCDTCGKEYLRRDNLKRHWFTHGAPTESLCLVCGEKFSRTDSLKRHYLKRHSLIDDLRKLVVCHVCGKTFHRTDLLKQHMTTHVDTLYKCGYPSCGKTFASKANLQRHGKCHENAEHHVCNQCGKMFSRKDSYIRHKKRRCYVRQKQQKRTGQLKEKPCTTRSTAKSQLACINCDEKFTRKSSLTRHINCRLSPKLHKCSTCNKAYTRKDSLHKHNCTGKRAAPTQTTPSSKQRMKMSRKMKKFRAVVDNDSPKSKAHYAEYLMSSPKTQKILEAKNVVQSKQQQQDQAIHTAVFKDVQTVMQATKIKKNTNSLRFRQHLLAAGIGENVQKTKKATATVRSLFGKKLSQKVKKGQLRKKIIEGDQAALYDITRKTRGEKIPQDWKSEISSYWKNEASRTSTDTKRPVTKSLGNKEYLRHTRHVMTKTYREAYIEFSRNKPDIKVSEATFRRCKPFFVKPATARDLEQCCCQRCITVRKAFRALMNFRQNRKCGCPIYDNVYDFLRATLCPKEEDHEYHQMKCINQECDNCGIGTLRFCEQELDENSNALVTWYCFDYVNHTGKDGKERRHLDIVQRKTNPYALIKHLRKELEGFSRHLFNAKWQRVQWQNLIENLPPDHLAIEMDFSENYSCTLQEEPQSIYWSHTQVTIHSCVLWRPIVGTDMSEDTHVKEHWLIISDDLHHDFHVVQHSFQQIIMPKLKEMGCNITKIHQRTDTCAAQYRSKNTFLDLSTSEQDLGVPRQVNYSGAGHGKGEVDAAAGYLKHAARSAVAKNIDLVITSAQELYNFATERLQTDSAKLTRRFIYLPKEDIDRDRDRLLPKTIVGTQKIHAACSVNMPGRILVNELSCYCTECINGSQNCEWKDYVQPMKVEHFVDGVDAHNVHESGEASQVEAMDTSDDACDSADEWISAVITKNSVIAIRPNSASVHDYFLFHVTSNGIEEVTESPATDVYGNYYPVGCKVARGFYYEHVKTNASGCFYKGTSDKLALVPKGSILYYDIEMTESNEMYFLPKDTHEDIMCSVRV